MPERPLLAARIAAPLAVAPPGSLEEFLIEHYWADTRGRDNHTREYRVAHRPWRTAPVDNVQWDCDVPATYNSPLAEYLSSQPTSAFISDGSPIELFRGQRI